MRFWLGGKEKRVSRAAPSHYRLRRAGATMSSPAVHHWILNIYKSQLYEECTSSVSQQ